MIKLKEPQLVGDTWQTSATSFTADILFVTPMGRVIAFDKSDNSIHRSEDKGNTWTSVGTSPLGRIRDIQVEENNNIIAYADQNLRITYSDNFEQYTINQDIQKRRYYYRTLNNVPYYSTGDSLYVWNIAKYTTQTEYITNFCVTSSGRIILFLRNKRVIYSDNQGDTWTDLGAISEKNYNLNVCHIHITPTGRIIVAMGTGLGTMYSDDNGITWNELWSDSTFNFCHTMANNRLIAYRLFTQGDTRPAGLYYSDDNGNTWTYINSITGSILTSCTPLNNRLLISQSGSISYSDSAPGKFAREKYLDQKSAQEIVTQFKAYVDAKVGA